MLSFESKYLTLNDSRVVANATISLGATSINLRDYDFSRFSEEQRKVIFRWTRNVDFFDYGPTFKSTLLSKKQVVINLSSITETISIELAGERVTLDSTPLPAGIYHLDLAIYLDRPLEALGEVPDHIKPMLQYSEIVNVLRGTTIFTGLLGARMLISFRMCLYLSSMVDIRSGTISRSLALSPASNC